MRLSCSIQVWSVPFLIWTQSNVLWMLVMQTLFTITDVVKSDPSIQFSWFISFIPVYCRIPPPPSKITWCNLHAPSRCSGWWMPAIHTHTRPSRSSAGAPLLQEITVMCCSTRFHSAMTRSTSLGSGCNASAEKEFYCLVLHCIISFSGALLPLLLLFISRVLLLKFRCSMLASLLLLWGCRKYSFSWG